LPLRSNIPAISEFVYVRVDPDFPKRAKEKGGGIIVGGDNYGQGSSREHAALAPMYLGVRAVIAKQFARIHYANLVNFGIPPLTFANPADYDRIEQGDVLEISGILDAIKNAKPVVARNRTKGFEFTLNCDLSPFGRDVMAEGGLLNYTRKHAA